MASRPGRRLLVALVTALTLTLSACGGSGDTGDTGAPVTGITTNDDDGYRGVYLGPDAYEVPAIGLQDTEGKPFDLATQDRRTLVFFGYTNCPDVCQIVMATMASALAKLSPAEREQLDAVFVTTDPARDTPAAMRTYLDRFDPSFRGVTGSLEDIVALGKPLDILVEKGRKLPSGGYEVDHSTVVVSVEGGRGDLVWTGATSPADMAVDLEKVLAEDAG